MEVLKQVFICFFLIGLQASNSTSAEVPNGGGGVNSLLYVNSEEASIELGDYMKRIRS